MKAKVLVRLKPGVLDVQGKAVERGFRDLWLVDLQNVRVGRLIELEVQAADEESARGRIREACEKLLVNPIIENYELITE